jgi:drug/metabolite transporter (DMT)-like permease
MNRRLGLLQIHAAALLAGATGLFGKLLAVGPEMITAGRTVFGFLALWAAVTAWRVTLRLESRAEAWPLAVAGAALAAHWYCFFHSIQLSTVAVGVLSFASFPCFVALLEPLFFEERWRQLDLLNVALVVAGIFLITPSLSLRDNVTRGVLWGLLSGLAYAGFSLLSRRQVKSQDALSVAFYQQGWAALCSVPFALSGVARLTGREILLLAILGIVFTALLQGLLVASLRHLRAQTASIIIGLEPVYGIGLAALLLHETPSPRTFVGGALICAAVAVSTLKS